MSERIPRYDELPVTPDDSPERNKPGSIGPLIPNTESRVVDYATGDDVGPNVDGEVWIRGPQVMKGYLNNPQATAMTIDADGWLHTGDIGHADEDGYLFVVDRVKDMIIRGGLNVYPRDSEEVLHAHPGVLDVAVVGVADPDYGEEVEAFVVKMPGIPVTEEELLAFCRERLAKYKSPKRVTFLPDLPKNQVGKVLKRDLRELAAKRES